MLAVSFCSNRGERKKGGGAAAALESGEVLFCIQLDSFSGHEPVKPCARLCEGPASRSACGYARWSPIHSVFPSAQSPRRRSITASAESISH